MARWFDEEARELGALLGLHAESFKLLAKLINADFGVGIVPLLVKEQWCHTISNKFLLLEEKLEQSYGLSQLLRLYSLKALSVDIGEGVRLVSHHGVFGPLGQLALWFHISGFKLCLESGDLLHVTFGKLLKTHLVRGGHRKLFLSLLQLIVQLINLTHIISTFRVMSLIFRA